VLDLEALYAIFLVIALVLNGVALTVSTPVRALFAPLREVRLVLTTLGLDTILVPSVIIGLAVLVQLDDITLAGLIIVAAASAGPIGIALARIAHGDIPLSVTLVTGIGLLNLITVPLITGLLLPESVPLPLGPVLSSLVTLLVLPLLLGRLVGRLLAWRSVPIDTRTRLLGAVGSGATASLAGAVTVALFLEPELVLDVLLGPVTPIAIVTMLAVMLAARTISHDHARRRTIAVVINARAVGLALTLTALHFGDVPGLRATVLAYGGLTQMVPIIVVIGARQLDRVRTPEG
jgi:BASS family bile acid:Na+ symporter